MDEDDSDLAGASAMHREIDQLRLRYGDLPEFWEAIEEMLVTHGFGIGPP